MQGVRGDIVLEYDEEPEPSFVLVVSAIVGFVEVLQTTPLAVMAEAHDPDTVPPDIAELAVLPEMATVSTLAVDVDVGTVISLP